MVIFIENLQEGIVIANLIHEARHLYVSQADDGSHFRFGRCYTGVVQNKNGTKAVTVAGKVIQGQAMAHS